MPGDADQQLTRVRFAQTEPLTTRLHGLIRSYPRGVGLIQEFLQNADDAGASTVAVWLDERVHPSYSLPAATMSSLQGPAIVVTNNACFTDQDWDRLQKIGQSGKSLDSSKTGRFGLGFNSVYNVTDFPCILSGNTIGMFDPHGSTVADATPQQPGNAWRLDNNLWGRARDLISPFLDFGLGDQAMRLDATAFRLPLRTAEQAELSEICSSPFGPEDFDAIIAKLSDRVGELLLFLNHVTDITFGKIDAKGERELVLAASTVNSQEVTGARAQIHSQLDRSYSDVLTSLRDSGESQHVTFNHSIRISVTGTTSSESWLVTRGLFVDSDNQLIDHAEEMFSIEEKAMPLAGAASLLASETKKKVAGRIYCSLPLPPSSPIRGIHIDGFFDLQADRQGLFEDPEAEGNGAVRVRWNKSLAQHACAKAVSLHCLRLAQLGIQAKKSPYSHWPRVPQETRNLLDELPRWTYSQLTTLNCIPARSPEDWLAPRDVLIIPDGSAESLYEPLLADELPIPNPRMPRHVTRGFAACNHELTVITAERLRDELRIDEDCEFELSDPPRPCLGSREWIMSLLSHCVSDGELEDLDGVPLGLLSSGMVRSFSFSRDQRIFLADSEQRAIFESQPHWFIDEELQRECALEPAFGAGLLAFTPQLVLENLKAVTPLVESHVRVDPSTYDNVPSSSWLTNVFEYLAKNRDKIRLRDELIKQLPLVPDQFNTLRTMKSASTPLLASEEDQNRLGKALRYFNVPVVHGSNELMSAIRMFVEAYPDEAIYPMHPRDLIETLRAVDGPQNSDEDKVRFSRDRHGVVLDYLASRNAIELKGEPSDLLDILRGLRLFPSQNEAVRIDESDYYVPERYELPGIQTDVGTLHPGPRERWIPLYRTLGIPTLTRAKLVREQLLPKLPDLSKEDLLSVSKWLRKHLPTIREEEDDDTARELITRLAAELPIVCTDGVNRTANVLYHPDKASVGKLLGDGVGFPDLSTYNDRPELWIDFFAALGMANTPRVDDIVTAIDHILEAPAEYSEKCTRIGEIAHYLEKYWDDLHDEDVSHDDARPNDAEEWHLADALRSREWIPALQEPPRDVPADVFAKPDQQFYKPDDLFARDSINLVSAVQPVCALNGIHKLSRSIEVLREPELDELLAQLACICGSSSINADGMIPRPVADMLKSVYRHLGRSLLPNANVAIDEVDDVQIVRSRVRNWKCIFDDSLRLWRPRECFSRRVTHFLGRAAQVQSRDPEIENGLAILGRREAPDANDFRALFNGLASEHDGAAVPEDDRQLIRIAYREAACISEPGELIDAPVLTNYGLFALPREVVLDDANWISDRIIASEITTLDPELGLQVAVAFGIRRSSVSVYEMPVYISPSSDRMFIECCEDISIRIRSPEFLLGVERLIVAEGNSVRRDQLYSHFEGLSVIGVGELKTTLVWLDEDIPLSGSVGQSDLTFDPDDRAFIVSEQAKEVLLDLFARELARQIEMDGHSLGKMAANLAPMLRVPPEQMDGQLTRLRVPKLPEESSLDLVEEQDGGRIGSWTIDEDDTGISRDPIQEYQEACDVLNEQDCEAHTRDADAEFEDGGTKTTQSKVEKPTQGKPSPEGSSSAKTNCQMQEKEITGTQPTSYSGIAGPQQDPSKSDCDDTPTVSGSRTGQDRCEGNDRKRIDDGRISDSRRRAGWLGRPRERGGTEPSQSPTILGGRKSWIAVTRVKPLQDDGADESPEKQQRRRLIDQAAVKRVISYELDRGRRAIEMDHLNEGYDLESVGPDGEIERYIEVKGLSGAWTEFGVSISRAQHRKAMREGKNYWLYVVEFASEPERSRVFAIQDPAELIDQYWFDDGWKLISKEKDGTGMGALPREGAIVMVDGTRRGRVKEVKSHGALQHLQIEFDNGQTESVVFSPRRLSIIEELETE